MFKIDKIEFKSDLFLAPMAGYTDAGFRSLCARFGAGLTTTEMVSAKGLIFESKGSKELLATVRSETPKEVQLFGSEPDVLATACKHPSLKKFDLININMGCPVNKVFKNNEGCSLMANPGLAAEIVAECVRATKKPITVKFRLGLNEESKTAVSFAKALEKAGAKMLTVHGRTRAQGYSGKADWAEIKKVVRAVNTPVAANGDVKNKQDYLNIKAQTGAAAVMIGRGALGRPYVFSEILDLPYKADLFKIIKEHYRILFKFFPYEQVIKEMRKHLLFYIKNSHGAKQIRTELLTLNDYGKIEENLNRVLR